MYPAIGEREDWWEALSRMGFWAAIILFLYCLSTMAILMFLGGAPLTAQACFEMIQKNVVIAVLRLDILTVLVMPVFCLIYAGLYAVLRQECRLPALVSFVSSLIGVTLILASTSVTSLLYLADQYATATTDARRTLLLAAGEAVISNDMWHGTAAKMGGVLLQSAGVLISIAMLRSTVFNQAIGYTGLIANGLDLVHIFLGFFWPSVAVFAMAIGGTVYLLWFPLVARRLRQLSRFPVQARESAYS